MQPTELTIVAGIATIVFDLVKRIVPRQYWTLGAAILGYGLYAGYQSFTGSGDMLSNMGFGLVAGLESIGLHELVVKVKALNKNKK